MRCVHDTSPEAARIQIEIYRRMSGAERLALAFEISEFAREFCLAGIRRRHPDWGEAEVRHEMVRYLSLGPSSSP